MKFKRHINSKLVSVPFPFWILSILILLFPFLIVNPSSGALEFIWFLYIIPAFIFSYYWGIWGGMFTAFITVTAQIVYELLEYYHESGDYKNENYIVIIITSLISFGIALGIGLLAGRLKRNQKILEKVNLDLQSKNKLLDDISHMDELTGLWNRRGLLKLAHQSGDSVQDQHHFSVLFIDLDKFKPVNDTYGHQVGDQLLQDVAKRLTSCLDEKAVISRIGGDEFAILLQTADEDYSIQIAKEIKNELSKVFFIKEYEIFITPSIGISLSSTYEKSVDSLLQFADIAMYYVKRQGRNDYLIFDKSMKELTENRINLENQLRKALEREEFVLFYQPQMDVKTGKMVGLEALIRWVANGKVISPIEFIPVAEEMGLIVPIGKWVFETACRQMNKWMDEGYPSLPISVNVSSHQFQHLDFVQTVRKVLKDTCVDPKLIRLELTESVILGNEEIIISKLKDLKQLGISLSIDDFGSGYSSLAYLKNFPIDEIKMDKSFIDEITHNIKDRLLVRTIIQLGQSLNVRMVAEGVETKEQLTFLQEAGCSLIQGYLVGKPMPVTEITKVFQKEFLGNTVSF